MRPLSTTRAALTSRGARTPGTPGQHSFCEFPSPVHLVGRGRHWLARAATAFRPTAQSSRAVRMAWSCWFGLGGCPHQV